MTTTDNLGGSDVTTYADRKPLPYEIDADKEKDNRDAQWERVRARLRAEFGDAAFKTWLEPIAFLGVRGGDVRLGAPSRFLRDWVAPRYGDRIRAAWRLEDPDVLDVEIAVRERTEAKPATVAEAPVAAPAAPVKLKTTEFHGTDLTAQLDPRFTFENFVVGKPNEFAHAAARRVAESATVPFNPLFIYGGVGLGKTHLMHAIAWHIAQRSPDRKVIYLSAEKFMHQFIRALRFKDTVSFKEQFRSVDVLMIDDVQFISGKDSTQEEFFHTFNALVDQGHQIVVTGDRSPSDLDGMEERMRSRLGWGLVAEVHATNYELRLSILHSKAEQLGRGTIPQKVLEFVAHRISSNIRELEGALNRLVAHADFSGGPITLETAQEVLHDLLRANNRRITIEEIQKKVAEYYNIRLNDIVSQRRARVVARPRQVAMYLAKQLTSRSLPEIGRKFGGRDHTTVMHAVKKIEQLRNSDATFAEDVELLRRVLES